MARSITFIIGGDVETEVTITETSEGGLLFEIEALESGRMGDLRGLYFDLSDVDASSAQLSATATAEFDGDITSTLFSEGDDNAGSQNLFRLIANILREHGPANLAGNLIKERGGYDVGIEFGTPGIGQDDIQKTSFVLSSALYDLTLDMLGGVDFGVRYTSVGDWGARFRLATDLATGTVASPAQNDYLAAVAENAASSGFNVISNDTGSTNAVLAGYSIGAQTYEAGEIASIVSGGLQLGSLTLTSDGTMTISADGGDVDRLNVGESTSISVTYSIRNEDGSLATADAFAEIEGANDAPEIGAQSETTGAVDEDGEDAPTVATGQLFGSDPDSASALNWSISGSATGTYGVLSIDSEGVWTYVLDNEIAIVQDLTQADLVEDQFTVLLSDEHGLTDEETITVSVTGSEDGPSTDNSFEGTDGQDRFLGLPGSTYVVGLGNTDFLAGDYYELRSGVFDGPSQEYSAWYVHNQHTYDDSVGFYYDVIIGYIPNFGDDIIETGAGFDEAYGDVYYLTIDSKDRNTEVILGNDRLSNLSEIDSLYGDAQTIQNQAISGFLGTVIAGNDLLEGAEGNDQLWGEAVLVRSYASEFGAATGTQATSTGGNDSIYGFGGNDLIYGDATYLIASVAGQSSSGNTQIIATVTSGVDDIYGGDGNDTVYGDAFEIRADIVDRLALNSGTATAEVICGADQIYGNAGSDELFGDGYTGKTQDQENVISGVYNVATVDGGDDTIEGGADDDIITGDFRDAIANSDTDVSGLYRVSGGNDNLYGDDGNDTIYGDFIGSSARSYHADGYAQIVCGNDTITGGSGDDQLWGDYFATGTFGGGSSSVSRGNDTFVFNPGSGLDVISDFQIGSDLIDVSGYGISEFAQLQVSTSGADTIIDLDGTSDDIDEILLVGAVGLDGTEFIYSS